MNPRMGHKREEEPKNYDRKALRKTFTSLLSPLRVLIAVFFMCTRHPVYGFRFQMF